MTPLPAPPTPTSIPYATLTSILTNPTTSPLEIDILPPTHSSTLQHTPSPPSLGIPKPLLPRLYLHAHTIFFTHLQSHPPPSHNAATPTSPALDASAILLLWDPNHVTAINCRKRHLLALRSTTAFSEAVAQERWFLGSLVTSPLPRHTKSSTLWGHRLWLLRVARGCVLQSEGTRTGKVDAADRRGEDVQGGVEGYWDAELEVVMRAGERHARNYYAWLYARDLLRELRDGSGWEKGREQSLAKGCLQKVYGWCLGHPRDISGWAFLRCLLREIEGGGGEGQRGRGGGEEVGRVVWGTREFVRKYEWRGESIEWFLESTKEIVDSNITR